MTEQEYIDRGDQTTIRTISLLLARIVPSISSVIKDDELLKVRIQIDEWERKYFEVLKID